MVSSSDHICIVFCFGAANLSISSPSGIACCFPVLKALNPPHIIKRSVISVSIKMSLFAVTFAMFGCKILPLLLLHFFRSLKHWALRCLLSLSLFFLSFSHLSKFTNRFLVGISFLVLFICLKHKVSQDFQRLYLSLLGSVQALRLVLLLWNLWWFSATCFCILSASDSVSHFALFVEQDSRQFESKVCADSPWLLFLI